MREDLGGYFELLGTSPVAGSLSKYRSVYFDNNPMVLKDAGGALVTAPSVITGAGNYTVSAWLREPNPTLPDQQTYVSWARRGGPDGTNCEMVFGTDGIWGAGRSLGRSGPGMGQRASDGRRMAQRYCHLQRRC